MIADGAKDALGRTVDVAPIGPLLDRIVREFRPTAIRLFGSRARGEGGSASDWDLFVIVPDNLDAADDPFAGYRLRREMRVRADVILCPEAEYDEDRDTPNTLSYEAAHHGVTLYER